MAINDVLHCDVCEFHPEKIRRINESMPDEDEIYDLAELFKVFGDSTRMRILFALFEDEICVCDLAEILHMTQSAGISLSSDMNQEPDVPARADDGTGRSDR